MTRRRAGRTRCAATSVIVFVIEQHCPSPSMSWQLFNHSEVAFALFSWSGGKELGSDLQMIRPGLTGYYDYGVNSSRTAPDRITLHCRGAGTPAPFPLTITLSELWSQLDAYNNRGREGNFGVSKTYGDVTLEAFINAKTEGQVYVSVNQADPKAVGNLWAPLENQLADIKADPTSGGKADNVPYKFQLFNNTGQTLYYLYDQWGQWVDYSDTKAPKPKKFAPLPPGNLVIGDIDTDSSGYINGDSSNESNYTESRRPMATYWIRMYTPDGSWIAGQTEDVRVVGASTDQGQFRSNNGKVQFDLQYVVYEASDGNPFRTAYVLTATLPLTTLQKAMSPLGVKVYNCENGCQTLTQLNAPLNPENNYNSGNTGTLYNDESGAKWWLYNRTLQDLTLQAYAGGEPSGSQIILPAGKRAQCDDADIIQSCIAASAYQVTQDIFVTKGPIVFQVLNGWTPDASNPQTLFSLNQGVAPLGAAAVDGLKFRAFTTFLADGPTAAGSFHDKSANWSTVISQYDSTEPNGTPAPPGTAGGDNVPPDGPETRPSAGPGPSPGTGPMPGPGPSPGTGPTPGPGPSPGTGPTPGTGSASGPGPGTGPTPGPGPGSGTSGKWPSTTGPGTSKPPLPPSSKKLSGAAIGGIVAGVVVLVVIIAVIVYFLTKKSPTATTPVTPAVLGGAMRRYMSPSTATRK